MDLNQNTITPNIISRDKHSISRKNIAKNALVTLYRLKKYGYQAYLVGGAVRDLLLDVIPKDYDVVTNATPQEIRRLFKNSFIIGKRFKLVHVIYNKEIIEVITFRKSPELIEKSPTGLIKFDNTFGDINEDSVRRDLTINALYYNIKDFTLVDYFKGFQDLQNKVIRIIGDPLQRFTEDPVRILRVIRFAAKFDWPIAIDTTKAIFNTTDLVKNITPARLYEEYKKLFIKGFGKRSYEELKKYELLEHLFINPNHMDHNLISKGLDNLDSEYGVHADNNPMLILALFILGDLLKVQDFEFHKFKLNLEKYISKQRAIIHISNNEAHLLKNIILIQEKFKNTKPKNTKFLLKHKHFPLAFKLFHIRYLIHEVKPKLYNYWQNLNAAD